MYGSNICNVSKYYMITLYNVYVLFLEAFSHPLYYIGLPVISKYFEVIFYSFFIFVLIISYLLWRLCSQAISAERKACFKRTFMIFECCTNIVQFSLEGFIAHVIFSFWFFFNNYFRFEAFQNSFAHLALSLSFVSHHKKVFLWDKSILIRETFFNACFNFIFLWDCYMSVTFCYMYLEIWPFELHSFWSFQRVNVLNTFIDSFCFTLNVAFRGKLFMGKLFLSAFHILCSHVWLRDNICTQRACVIFFLNITFILNQPFEVSIVLVK